MFSMNLFIFGNPMSGSQSGQLQINQIVEACTKCSIHFKLFQTQRAGELPELLEKNLPERNEHTKVVIIGGDGTLNEALQYLKQNEIEVPLSYLPAGTGNDFAREMNLTHDADVFVQIIENAPSIELEFLTYHEQNSGTSGIALNSLGFGIDAAICELNQKQRQAVLESNGIKKASYLTPILKAFREREEFEAVITIDNNESFTVTHNLLVGAFNHSFFGGGIRFVPTAQQGNHSFEVVVARKVSGFTILKAFPFILTNGSHFKHFPNHLQKYQCTAARIQINGPIKSQTDGEFTNYGNVDIRIQLDSYPFILTKQN